MDTRIALVIQNIAQYFCVKPLIPHLQKKYELDILIYGISDNKDYLEISNDLQAALEKDGLVYHASDNPPHKSYKICLAPYTGMINAKYDYLICYRYSTVEAKPSITCTPECRLGFHAIMVHNTYESEILSNYCKTFIVPSLRYELSSYKPRKTGTKKALLYLPTYGSHGEAPDIMKNFQSLKKKYYIIVKTHHGLDHLVEDSAKKDTLTSIADEYYDSTADLGELFQKADVVVSDNSGAIFDALYIGAPVCIVAREINKKLGSLSTLQSQAAKKGIIPWAKGDNPKKIAEVIEESMSPSCRKKQQQFAAELFMGCEKGGVTKWLDVIDKFMNDDIDQNYIQMHDYCVEYFNKRTQTIKEQSNEIDRLQAELNYYYGSYSHRIIRKIKKVLKLPNKL